MFAILTLGVSFGAIIGFQAMLLNNSSRAHAYALRLSYIKDFFVKVDRENLYTKNNMEEKINFPKLTINYSAKDSGNVKGFENFKDIIIEKLDVSWQLSYGKYKETFVRFKFKQDDQNSDNKK